MGQSEQSGAGLLEPGDHPLRVGKEVILVEQVDQLAKTGKG